MIAVAQREKPLDPDASIMTVREVSKYLRVSISTIYRLAERGELSAFKVSADWRFRRVALDAWMCGKVAVSKTASV